jgi:hypothetical protein
MITDHRGSDQIKDARMSQSIHTLQQIGAPAERLVGKDMHQLRYGHCDLSLCSR